MAHLAFWQVAHAAVVVAAAAAFPGVWSVQVQVKVVCHACRAKFTSQLRHANWNATCTHGLQHQSCGNPWDALLAACAEFSFVCERLCAFACEPS